MKFSTVNYKERHHILLVNRQCGGSSVVSLACISSMCLVQCFLVVTLFFLAFGIFFYPINPPLIFPLILFNSPFYQNILASACANEAENARYDGVDGDMSSNTGAQPVATHSPASSSHAPVNTAANSRSVERPTGQFIY